eukprot:jgi/Ulvmu1/8869/UM049_0051.1
MVGASLALAVGEAPQRALCSVHGFEPDCMLATCLQTICTSMACLKPSVQDYIHCCSDTLALCAGAAGNIHDLILVAQTAANKCTTIHVMLTAARAVMHSQLMLAI